MKRLRNAIDDFEAFVSRPLFLAARPILLVLIVPMALAFTQPLWHMHFQAPQYPDGLDLHVHAYKLVGGHEGHDIKEINTLNHYIGMRQIDRNELSDLDWIPFAFGFLILFALRVAIVGNVRSLIDLAVITLYVGLFSLGRFAYKLWLFGHDLDPKAPIDVEPFMPVVIGRKTIANFEIRSWPAIGTWYVACFAVGILAVLGWHLVVGRLQAVRERRAEG